MQTFFGRFELLSVSEIHFKVKLIDQSKGIIPKEKNISVKIPSRFLNVKKQRCIWKIAL